MSVRSTIYDLLHILPVPVYTTRLDPFKADKFPLISVQNVNTKRKQIADSLTYRVTSDVSVIISVATTDSDFDAQLDTIVDSVLAKILTDKMWDTQFENVPDIETKYGYVKAGETDLSTAYINFSVVYTETYDPTITATYQTASVDIDFIYPFDINRAVIGPDGKIEGHLTLTLPQT